MYGSPACLSLVIDPSFQHLISLAGSSAIIHVYDCSLKQPSYSISVVWGLRGEVRGYCKLSILTEKRDLEKKPCRKVLIFFFHKETQSNSMGGIKRI